MHIQQALILASLLAIFSPISFGDDNVDPYLWLEDVEGEKALEWAEARNSESLAILQNLPEYQPLYDKNLAVYDSDESIAYPRIRGDFLYNFWRDADNERGLWRRTTIEEYGKDKPQWEILLDLDELGVGRQVCVGQDTLLADQEPGARSASRSPRLPWQGEVLTLDRDVDLDDAAPAFAGGREAGRGGPAAGQQQGDDGGGYCVSFSHTVSLGPIRLKSENRDCMV